MFEKILVDIHSHIFPGLDDGSRSLSDSIEIATKLYNLGYRKMVVTPHNQKGWFNNPPEKIFDALNKLNVAFSVHRLPMKLEAASEYYLDSLFIEHLRKNELLTFGNNYVLIELSPFIFDKNLFSALTEVQEKGYTPVLAHPERYIYFYTQKEKYHQLHEMGVKLQLNLVALSQYVSNEMRCTAEYLVDNKLVSFCGSDSHSLKNPMIIEQLPKETPYFEKLILTNPLLNSSLI